MGALSSQNRQHTMSLRIVVGPMFAGKTSEVQSVVRRFGCLGKKVLVLTAEIDNRYADVDTSGNTFVVNHDKNAVPARAVPIDGLVAVTFWREFEEATAIIVDEAQFFVDCLIPFVRLAVDQYGKHVVVVGLDSDASRRPFGDVLALAAHADSIEKKTALCKRCGDGTEAIFTRKLVVQDSVGSPTHPSGDPVEVGGSSLYEAVCRKHFNTV